MISDKHENALWISINEHHYPGNDIGFAYLVDENDNMVKRQALGRIVTIGWVLAMYENTGDLPA